MMDGEAKEHEVRSALAGDEPALTRLVQALTPVIQSRVARGLLLRRTGTASGRDIRQEVEDLTQEIFLLLFAEGGKVLRSWQPERGLSLLNFVGLVAERQTASILRSGKRSPWKEDPTLPEDLDQAAPESGPEEIAASREQLRRLLHRLTEELTPLGRHLFDLLFLRELPFEEVTRQTGMTPDAVYAWRSRLRRLARRLLDETSETHLDPRTPVRGRKT
jgi:RNA polymerase sigma factor (sigma-70 family)